MAKQRAPSLKRWFENSGGWSPRHDLNAMRRGIEAGLLDAQDEYGLTALGLAVASGWLEGVAELLRAGADTGLRYFRTGETPLHLAVQNGIKAIIEALVAGGANPDAGNHWGFTPRAHRPQLFEAVPPLPITLPEPRIQNAEHLADHYHPRFHIPEREERETLRPGQAVDLHVYGPRAEGKQDWVKVRITSRSGRRPGVRYEANVETLIEQTHLTPGTTTVQFGPEHVATVYVPRPTSEE